MRQNRLIRLLAAWFMELTSNSGDTQPLIVLNLTGGQFSHTAPLIFLQLSLQVLLLPEPYQRLDLHVPNSAIHKDLLTAMQTWLVNAAFHSVEET